MVENSASKSGVWRNADMTFSLEWKKCTHRSTSFGTSGDKKAGLGSLWILSIIRSVSDSVGTSVESSRMAYCSSCCVCTDSGTPKFQVVPP